MSATAGAVNVYRSLSGAEHEIWHLFNTNSVLGNYFNTYSACIYNEYHSHFTDKENKSQNG